MSHDGEEVRKTLRRMDSEELLHRIKSWTLTSEAHQIALAELGSRGISKNALPSDPIQIDVTPRAPGFLARCWNGKEPLWKAFWLLGLGVIVLHVPRYIISVPVLALGYALLIVAVHILWWVSIWRCAFRTSHWFWGVAARAWVGVSAAVSALHMLILVFLPNE